MKSVALEHDAAEPVGYVLGSGDVRFGYLTDFGSITDTLVEALNDVDALVIESNHDEDMLRDGPYPWTLKKRVASPTGHLSNRQLAAFLGAASLPRCRSLVLAHLSETNNKPELALASARQAVSGWLPADAVRRAFQDRALPLESVTAPASSSNLLPFRRPAGASKAVQLSFSYEQKH